MKIGKFLVLALLIFSLGIAVLYGGYNRVPFKKSPDGHNHQQHNSGDTSASVYFTV